MEGKGIVKLFLVLLLIVTVLQFFYMVPTRNVERNADDWADQVAAKYNDADEANTARKIAKNTYLDSMSSEEIFSIPGFTSFTYSDLKGRQLAYGLDLKGGMSAVLQVDLKQLLTNLASKTKDENFNAALVNAEKRQENSQSDFISLFSQEFSKLRKEGDKSLATIFMRNSSMRELINASTSDGEVTRILREQANETVKLTFNRLKQRIDKLGVTQPNVSLDAARDLILVEMPGIDNPARAREFLTASANLEFWNTYRINDTGVQGWFNAANDQLKVGGTTEYDTIWQTIDSLGNIIQNPTEFTLTARGGNDPLFSKLIMNGAADGVQRGALTIMGFADKNKKKAVDEMLLATKDQFPADAKFMWSRKPFQTYDTKEVTKQYSLYMIKKQSGKDEAPIEGDAITSSSHGPNPTGEVAVNIVMNSSGAKKWAALTKAAAANGEREIAIALDNEIVSAPGVRAPIEGGRSEITGNFSMQEASDFSSILEVGKLPARTKIIQSATVGPSLGEKNINSSFRALLFGFGLLLLFMAFYYGGAGIIAILALLLNVFFIVGALGSFGTVLTLPGFAGIILTIGMAVDVNVIVFERIREELRAGKSNLAAINDGFKHSYSAIIDANVTTILVAIVLAWFGMGPIRGFAVVLIIGVLCSLFTALLIGRMMIEWWTKGDRNLSFWTGPTKNAFANLNIDWIGKRKIAYVISGSIILLGLVSIFTRGFDLGVDFKGGYSYNVQFEDDIDIDAETLRGGLAQYFESAPAVKSVDTDNTFNIVTDYLINDKGEKVEEKVIQRLYEGITAITGKTISAEKFVLTDGEGTHVTSSSKVGPTIADDIKKSSFYAGIFALLLIFLYIFIRFSKWQYSLGAVAALAHDSLIVLGLFSLLWNRVPFSMEVDQAFIAAILTVIGYSINDTVVVFDRIREYLGIYTNKSTDEVLNLAINSTFSRTIVTSLTTLLVITILFIFGGGTIKGFAFALLIGVVVGTYSSIFVATPIVRDFSKDLKVTRKASTEKKSFSRATQS